MLKHLEVKNVRVFSSFNLKFDKEIVIFVGNNGVGKTSILEAIYFLGLTKSHRTSNEFEMLKFNEKYGKVIGKEKKEFQIVFNEKKKKAFINKKEVKKISDYIGNFKVVIFSPDDLEIVKGSPTIRRRFLDIEISQLSENYLEALSKYKKILKQRTELLKKLNIGDDLIFLNIITNKLINEAKKIIKYRNDFINELNANLICIMDEKISLKYLPSVNEENIDEMFNNRKKTDILNKTNSVGPHRDEIKFLINDYDAIFASQGQIRSLVLSLKISLVYLIKNKTKEYPIVLLDDVLSELDCYRQNNLLEIINNFQTFITSTDLKSIKEEIIMKSQIFKIENNEIKELK